MENHFVNLAVDITDKQATTKAWLHLTVPLEEGKEITARFRATPADKEIIAKTVIHYLKEWLDDSEDIRNI